MKYFNYRKHEKTIQSGWFFYGYMLNRCKLLHLLLIIKINN